MSRALYRAEATASHEGRDGTASSADGRLDVRLSIPTELGGAGGDGTNPEQLFAAGYAACFTSALNLAGRLERKATAGSSVTAAVDLVKGEGKANYALEVTLEISLPELAHDEAVALAEQAHQVCPYSNATRGNMPVELVVR